MCNETGMGLPRTGIAIDDETLEEVDEYRYLGKLNTSGNKTSAETDLRMAKIWSIQQIFKRQENTIIPEEDGHGHGHTTSNDLWRGNMDLDQTPKKKIGSCTKKHGKVDAEHHEERQN